MQFPAGFTPQLLSAGAADSVALNGDAAVITTKALTTVAGATYTFTVQSALVKPSSVVLASVGNGTNSAGTPAEASCTVAAAQMGPGTITLVIQNIHATNAFNGTLVIMLAIFN
jgi:hypothetical protein